MGSSQESRNYMLGEIEEILNSSKDSLENQKEAFKVPQTVLDYLNALIDLYPDKARKLKVLKFDIEDDISADEIDRKIRKAYQDKLIHSDHAKEILDILYGNPVSESKKKDESTYHGGQEMSDADKENNLKYILDTFGEKPFTAKDYLASAGLLDASEEEIAYIASDFDRFVLDKSLKKNPDGSYQIVSESKDVIDKVEVSEEDLDKLYERFGTNPFTLRDYFTLIDKGFLNRYDIENYTEHFDNLVSAGELTKNPDGSYQFIQEESDSDSKNEKTVDYKIGGNVSWEGEEREIINIDDDWVSFKNGPIVARDYFNKVMSGEEEIFSENDEDQEEEIDENPPKGPSFLDKIKQAALDEERKARSTEGKPEAKPEDLPEKELETEEQINEQLSKARSEYASALVDYKNTIREKKKWWQKVIDELSFEKPMPEVGKPQELLDAEKAYMEAKKKKAKSLFGKDEIREYKGKTNEVLSLKEGEQFLFNSKLVEQAEEEYRILQKRISENSPPLEKKILARNFEKWTQLPTWQRVAYSSSLITIAGVAFGSVALGGAIATFAYRTARSLAGAGIGQAVGKAYGEVLKERAEKRTEKAGQEYGRDINLDNFEEKERKLAEFYEKEESQRKKDFLKKAGLMAVAGAATNIGLEFTTKGLMDVSGVSKSSGNISEGRSGAKISPEGSRVRPEVGRDVIPQKGGGIKVEPVKVELSSKGFIKTFEDMKGQLKAKYPDEAKMPKGVKDFMETDNTKLAQKYGFYDPNKNLSGMGFKGESLSLDEKGELHYNHLDGKSDIIDTADHKFAGKMFKPEDLTESKVTPKAPGADLMPERQVETPDLQEPSDSIVNPNSGVESLRVESQNVPPSIENSFDLKIDSKQFHVDFVKDGINKPAIMVDNVKIAEQVPYPYGQNGNMMQLLDKYQDGKKYAPLRQAFIEAQNKELGLIKGSSKFIEAQNVASTPFESGQIDIVRGIGGNKNSVEVLLNGKKIAEGLLTDKGPKVKIFSNLKGGIFLADTVYERAFKVASKTLKGIKFVK